MCSRNTTLKNIEAIVISEKIKVHISSHEVCLGDNIRLCFNI